MLYRLVVYIISGVKLFLSLIFRLRKFDLDGADQPKRDKINPFVTFLVVPLGRLQHFKNESMKGLTPEIEYEGEKLLLLIPQIALIPSKALNKPIGSLSHFRDEIIAALDFAIAGI